MEEAGSYTAGAFQKIQRVPGEAKVPASQLHGRRNSIKLSEVGLHAALYIF